MFTGDGVTDSDPVRVFGASTTLGVHNYVETVDPVATNSFRRYALINKERIGGCVLLLLDIRSLKIFLKILWDFP